MNSPFKLQIDIRNDCNGTYHSLSILKYSCMFEYIEDIIFMIQG